MSKPKPGRRPYKNSIVLIIEDTDLERGSINFESRFEVEPDISYGPQTPAEEVAALLMTFAHRNILKEHTTGAILMPDEWGPADLFMAETAGGGRKQ